MPPPPTRNMPWRDDATDTDLGKLLRETVAIVRVEAGHDRNDPDADVEIKVTIRRPDRAG